MQQLLKQAESTSFALGANDYITVQGCTVIDQDGNATVVTMQQRIGSFPSGATLRVIGGPGGGAVDVVNFSADDHAFLVRNTSGAVIGVTDPKTGGVVAFSGASVLQSGPISSDSQASPNAAAVIAFVNQAVSGVTAGSSGSGGLPTIISGGGV